MKFELDEAQCLVRDTARKFAREVLAKDAARFDRDGEIPASIYSRLGELGLMGVNVPEELGGSAAGVVAYSVALTEIASGCASTAVAMAVTNMVAEILVKFGTAEQAARFVPRLCAGAHGAFALSEAGAGSDPGGMATVARRDGDGYRLRGSKQWISHGDTAALFVVWARTGDEGPRGISCFLVDGGAEGLGVGRHEDKMGLRGSHTVSLQLDDVWVRDSMRLGELGHGFRIAMTALDGGRIGIASQSLGIAEAALDEAVGYAKERQAFGRPIADFQALQFKIADARASLDAARLLTLRAAERKERGEPFTKEASMAKVFATEAAWRVANDAVQILGGYGYTREFAVERHLRDVRVAQIYEGTSEIQRIVIARSL